MATASVPSARRGAAVISRRAGRSGLIVYQIPCLSSGKRCAPHLPNSQPQHSHLRRPHPTLPRLAAAVLMSASAVIQWEVVGGALAPGEEREREREGGKGFAGSEKRV
jgi:hypothetical protein